MKKLFEFLFLNVIVVMFSSCNVDEDITTALPPKIILDNESGVYTVKQGRTIVISPEYESAEDAVFCWYMDGKVLSASPILTFTQDEIGEYYITISVRNEGGYSEKEIRIDVVELEIPTVSIACDKNLIVATGSELKLSASIRKTTLPTTFEWIVNGNVADNNLNYTFYAEKVGKYEIAATATNEDGTHSEMINVEVLNKENMPFLWEFESTTLHTTTGRKLLISPSKSSDEQFVEYIWSVDGLNDLTGSDSQFTFIAYNSGEYHVNATAITKRGDTHMSISHTFTVTVYDEKTFYRKKNSTSSAYWNKVFEYTPAPGQFINELKTGGFNSSHTNQEAAINYAENRLKSVEWVSLGGFGGYIIVGFDHSIDNSGNYDFGVIGNAFDGSSEPGVVWVMQDENGNGQPDDSWYELAGSETDRAHTIQEYSVTYYRPNGKGMPVQWRDNLGNSGEIDYLAQFHTQDFYYPLWIDSDSYTLRGTRLESRNYDKSGNGSYWIQPHYDWGYADNFSPTDFKSADKANLFKISKAVDFEGNTINLSHIDFIKIQCAVNAKSGWLGELSTEVCGFYDYSLKK